jgi:hypothetical protein
MVFYPNHSAPLEKSGKLPWEIDFVIEDAEIKEGTLIADIWVELRCELGKTASYTARRDAKIISLVPSDQEFNGLSLSRGYKKDAPLIMSGYQMAADSHGDKKRLLFLNQLGVDIKGLSMNGYLKSVLKSITTQDLQKMDDVEAHKDVLERIRKCVNNGGQIEKPSGNKFLSLWGSQSSAI